VTETGLPFVVGMLVLLLLIPIQGRVAKLLQRASKEASQLTDERVRLTKQAIQGARTIKMSGWELLMDGRIRRARALEVAVLVKAGLVRGVHEGIYFLSPVLVGAATFIADSLLGNELDAGRVFSTLTLFNILQWDVVNFAGKAMQSVSEMWVSIGRLERLLLMPELPEDRLAPPPDTPAQRAAAATAPPAQVTVDGLTFSWEGEHGTSIPTLRNVSFQTEPGRILGLAGPVGSGKTTLLLAILGELAGPEEDGTQAPPPVMVSPRGPIAYAAQEPWILTGSVRDNIVMGRCFDAERYRAVLKAACLATDLRQWEHGDHTVIGDRGVNMSGGQKARIGLARMAYGDASLYLIDDALSALDPKVGRRVFDRLICGLLRGKTRVLATHQLQYLLNDQEVPRVLFLNRGKLRAEGTLTDLAGRGYFKDLLLPPSRAQSATNSPSVASSPAATPAATPAVSRESSLSTVEGLARLEEQCREQNMPAVVPGPEPVFFDLKRQETLTTYDALELAAAIKREKEAAALGAAVFGATAAAARDALALSSSGTPGAGVIPPPSPAAAAWARFRSRSRLALQTPKGGTPKGGGAKSGELSGGKAKGHFSSEPDDADDEREATAGTGTGAGAGATAAEASSSVAPSKLERAHTVAVGALARPPRAPPRTLLLPEPITPVVVSGGITFAPASSASSTSSAGMVRSASFILARQLAQGGDRGQSLGIGVMPSPALSAHSARSLRSSRTHAHSHSNVSLALPYIDDGHDGGLALAMEGDDRCVRVGVCVHGFGCG
jgi:ABC-type multidrug transport system fused ATPase/permease subunit